jgi:hypothetical protein
LTATFATRELMNIKSNKARVLATDSLLTFINKSIKSNETFFVVGPVPLFYYLINKRPVITDIWTCSPVAFENLGLKDSLIDYFLIPRKDPRDNSWPNSDIFPILECDKESVLYYKKYLDENLYGKIFENKMFSLYEAPQHIFNLKNSILLQNNNCTEFENGILAGWSRHRLNSIFSVSSRIFVSPPYAQKITYNNLDDETGLEKELLEENNTYYVEAWVFADQKVEIVIQAGSGFSSIKRTIEPNKWNKISAYLKATGKTLYIYTGSKLIQNANLYIDDIKVLKIN